jgi:hypothetical protein
MREELLAEVPSAEQLADTFMGYTWEQFKALSDEEIATIGKAYFDEAMAATEAPIKKGTEWTEEELTAQDETHWEYTKGALVFNRFADWRRHGIPDRNVTRSDVMEYIGDLIRARVEADPTYGRLTPEQSKLLPDHVRRLIGHVLGYFNEMRDPFDYYTIDDYSLSVTLGFESTDIAKLVENQVLQQVGTDPIANNVYLLTEPYYNYWLRRTLARPSTVEEN